MANTFTNFTSVKSKPHASAEKQVGASDPSARTDVINRPSLGLLAIAKRIVNTLWDGVTVDFSDLTTVSNLGELTLPITIKEAKGADVASAAALALGTDGNYVDVTGTTTITSISTKTAGTVVDLRFSGALTVTHNATSLIMPNAVNLTTVAGDVLRFRSLGSGNWRCVGWMLTTAPLGRKGADIASAAALNLGEDGDAFHVTGTTTITSVETRPAGFELTLVFDGALTLTYNATTLILQGSVNLTTAAGDVVTLISEGSGNWREKSRRLAAAATVLTGLTSIEIVRKTADQIVVNNSTTMTNVTGMSFALGATETVYVELRVIFVANASGDMKLGVTLPASATAEGAQPNSIYLAAADTIGIWSFGDWAAGGAQPTVSGGGNAAKRWHTVHAVVKGVGTAGTVQVQAAQVTAHASDLTVYTDSHMILHRI